MQRVVWSLAFVVVLVLAGSVLASGSPGDPPGDPLTVVAFGDVTARAGHGVDRADVFPAVYAALLADALGVEVEVVNRASAAVRPPAMWGSDIRSDGPLRTALARADVVIVWLCSTEMLDMLADYGPHQWPDPIRERLMTGGASAFVRPEDLVADVAVPLRAVVPEHATILVGDCFVTSRVSEVHAGQPYWPQLEELAYGEYRAALARAAAAIDAVLVPTYAALNGSDGATTVDAAFVLRDEPFRFNEAGHRFLAELFRQHDGLTRPLD